MLVTYKKDNVIKVNPISNNNPLTPKQEFKRLVPSLSTISGDIYLGEPLALDLNGVGRWGTQSATDQEMSRVCGIISTWLIFTRGMG